VLVLYKILYGSGLLVAILFAAVVMITGKGDAMSGGGGVRTTFKGKAGFDDYMSRATLILGILLFALVLFVDVLANHVSQTK
jgi:protein translocase SecG subunit